MNRRGFRIILVLSLAAAAVGLCISLTSSHKEEAVLPDGRVQLRLNEALTNEISDTSALTGLDTKIQSYMRQWGLHGASLAIMRNDSLVYAKGYGWADEEKQVKMQPSNILRVASVSKLLTAAGIMLLQDQGKLNIKDTVFGPRGILTDTTYTSVMKDPNYKKITVEDLLRHKGGFTSYGGDPMFSTRTIMQTNHLDTPPDNTELMRIMLRRRLRFVPGTSQYYSNFGYLLLSKVIEEVSGQPYEEFMQKNVLEPAGCYDMHIAGNYYKDKRKNEVRYYNGADTCLVDEFNNSGNMVLGGNLISVINDGSELAILAIGMTLVTRAAIHLGLCPEATLPKLVNLLREYGLPTETDYPAADLLAKMLSDKKRAGDTISLVVRTGWGKSQLYPVPVSQLPVWLDRGLGK